MTILQGHRAQILCGLRRDISAAIVVAAVARSSFRSDYQALPSGNRPAQLLRLDNVTFAFAGRASASSPDSVAGKTRRHLIRTPRVNCSVPQRIKYSVPFQQDRFDASVDVILSRHPARDADAHGGAAAPHGATAPARALVLNACNDAVRRFIIAERDHYLVQHDVVEDLNAGSREPFGKSRCEPAIMFDQVGEAEAAEGT